MIKRHFSKAAASYIQHAFVQQEVGRRLLERLEYTLLAPKIICDLGAGTGYFGPFLLNKFPRSTLISIDFSMEMLQQAKAHIAPSERSYFLCNDAEFLGLKQNSIDLIYSNLMLQWCANGRSVLNQVFNAGSPGGLLLFSTLGLNTLKELRASWEAIDLLPHTHEFIDMHDLGDALLSIGFQDPVLETENITIEYASITQLMRDLKGIGSQNSHPNRTRGLTGKNKFQAFTETYETFRLPNGALPVTYEVIYGFAFIPSIKPEPTRTGLSILTK